MVDFNKLLEKGRQERLKTKNMNENTQLQQIENQNLQAIFGNAVQEQNVNDLFTSGVNTSEFLPTVSIRGKEWRTVVNGEESRILERHLDVILVSSRPNVSKTFYAGAWGGSDAVKKPDCASSDGIYPDSNIESPQHSNCQTCPQAAWGSKVNPGSGKLGKACSDYRLIIVAMAANPDMLFQLRVPASSLKPLATYVKKIGMMGVPADGAITRLTFADSEFPQIEFNLLTTVQTAEQYAQIKALADRDDVQATLATRTNAAPVQIQAAPVAHAALQPVVVQSAPPVTVPQSTQIVTPSPQVETQQPTVTNADPVNTEGETPKSISDVLAKWGQQPKS